MLLFCTGPSPHTPVNVKCQHVLQLYNILFCIYLFLPETEILAKLSTKLVPTVMLIFEQHYILNVDQIFVSEITAYLNFILHNFGGL